MSKRMRTAFIVLLVAVCLLIEDPFGFLLFCLAGCVYWALLPLRHEKNADQRSTVWNNPSEIA
jgi:hypothetical protein